jgi:hypothetical protein
MPEPIDYSNLPEHMQDDARRYVEDGECGDFLRTLVSNQLVEAWKRADQINRSYWAEWVDWLLAEPPSICWGSPEKVTAWIRGHEAARRLMAPESESELREAWGR